MNKIVLIGAGSRSFGCGQVADMLQSKDLNRFDTLLCLVDSDPAALERAMNVARRMGKYLQSNIVNAKGIHPQHVGAIPEIFAVYSRTQYAIHELLTEAYRTGSKRLLLQALLLDPVVNSINGAEKVLDEMLELQKDYLPNFS